MADIPEEKQVESRSFLRRKAAQQGKSAPDFSKPTIPNEARLKIAEKINDRYGRYYWKDAGDEGREKALQTADEILEVAIPIIEKRAREKIIREIKNAPNPYPQWLISGKGSKVLNMQYDGWEDARRFALGTIQALKREG